ncbi:hypothetical protein L5F50_01250 [Aliarcobacter butzleri]|nr:hypothetical protein [Aliarcobacter butzleri]
MIEVFNKLDIEKIKNDRLKEYLYMSFDRLPSEYNYPEDGYFIVLENFEEIQSEVINLTIGTLNGFDNGLYSSINMVEMQNGIIEILIFIDNDINVSFIMLESILNKHFLDSLRDYII